MTNKEDKDVLNGQTAIVTGSTSGIGLGIAKALAMNIGDAMTGRLRFCNAAGSAMAGLADGSWGMNNLIIGLK